MERDSALRSVHVYCDGACRGNPGVGGYGVIVIAGGQSRELSGAEAKTTNNRMELKAAITGLELLEEPSKVTVVTDSQYVVKGITEWIHGWMARGWRKADKKPVLNKDLWQRLHALVQPHKVTWHWIKGHNGHVHNERCDSLANVAMDEFLKRRR